MQYDELVDMLTEHVNASRKERKAKWLAIVTMAECEPSRFMEVSIHGTYHVSRLADKASNVARKRRKVYHA